MSDYRRNYAHTKLCIECGSEYRGKNAQKYCSKRCGILVNNRNRAKGTEIVVRVRTQVAPRATTTVIRGSWWCAGPCAVCGSGFVSRHTDKTCSTACRAEYYRRRRASRKISVSDRLRRLIYEFDDYVCQICFEPTDPNSGPSSNWFPSLDHIVPRSWGGDDSVGNLRTAHRWCNSVRGDESYYTDADLRVA